MVELQRTPQGAACVSALGRGDTSRGCHGDHGLSIKFTSSSLDCPPFPLNKTRLCNAFFVPAEQGKHAKNQPSGQIFKWEHQNQVKALSIFFFKEKVYSFFPAPVSQCPPPKKGLNNIKTFFFWENIYLVFDTSVGTLKACLL